MISPRQRSLSRAVDSFPLEKIPVPIPTDLMIRWTMERGSMWDRFAMVRRVRMRWGYLRCRNHVGQVAEPMTGSASQGSAILFASDANIVLVKTHD